MIFTDIFNESAYAQEQNDGVAVFKQLIQAVKDKEQIDLKVGVEQFPVRYDEARFLLSLWNASDDKPEMAKNFGYIRWIQDTLEHRDARMSGAGMSESKGPCPVTGEPECYCDEKVDEMNKGGKHSDETLAKMSGDNHHSAWKKDKTTDEYKQKRKAQRVAYYKKKKEEEMSEATKEQEVDFHKKLDKLVHDTFGKSPEEMGEDKRKYVNDPINRDRDEHAKTLRKAKKMGYDIKKDKFAPANKKVTVQEVGGDSKEDIMKFVDPNRETKMKSGVRDKQGRKGGKNTAIIRKAGRPGAMNSIGSRDDKKPRNVKVASPSEIEAMNRQLRLDKINGITNEASLPDDFIPEPVVSQTLADMELTMDPASNEFYEYSYNKLLNNYIAQKSPEIKKKFNNAWNTAWAWQMRELYAKEQAKIKGADRGKFGRREDVEESALAIKGSDKMNSKQRHNAIMKAYPGAKLSSDTPGIYSAVKGAKKVKLISNIKGVRQVKEAKDTLNKFYRMGYDNGYDVGTKDHVDYSKIKNEKDAKLFDKGFDAGKKDARVADADIRARSKKVDETLTTPKNQQDKEHKVKALNALLADPNTSKDAELKQKIQQRLSQLGTQVNEDPTPKRRIMDFDNHSRYWSGTGEHQDLYTQLYNKLVPAQGPAKTTEGELLRAVGKIIYRHGNDGDNFSNASYEFLEKYVGPFDNLDEMADKVIKYVADKDGAYTKNTADFMSIADYGPGEYEKDWEQTGCNNCGGTGEIEYQNDDGEDEYEECDSCDGNGWIEQTTESIVRELKVKSNKRQRADDHHQKNRRTPGNVKGVRADTKDLKNASRDETKKDSNFEKVQEGAGIYPYKGWEYEQEMDHYPDVSKIFHSATKDGKQVDIDWSPYVDMEEEDFKLWVDLGMPDREAVNGIAPLNVDDLLKLAQDNPNVTHSLLVRERMQHLAGIKEADDDDSKEKKKGTDREKDEDDNNNNEASIDFDKLDAKTRIALKKAGIQYGAQTGDDPLAALITFVADRDSQKSKKIDSLTKGEADLEVVNTLQDKKIGNNRLQDMHQDKQIEKANAQVEKANAQIAQLDDIEKKKDEKQDQEIANLKAQIEKLINR